MTVMSTTTPMTADQLLQLRPKSRCELVAGELRTMSPAGWRHGEIVLRISGMLWEHIRPKDLGKLFGAETGFLLSRDPDTVRAPDVAFIARENLPDEEPSDAFWPGAPDLAVEVLSPSDRTGEVNEKIRMWLSEGTRLVWVVDPLLRTVTCYRSADDVAIITSRGAVDGGDVVLGFSCAVADFFPPAR